MNDYSPEMLCQSFKGLFDYDVSPNKIFDKANVNKIYLLTMRDFGFNLEQLNQLPFDAPQMMHMYPEMYKDSSSTIMMAKAIQYMMSKIANIDNFTITDLISPTPKRTRKFFSAIVDFHYSNDNLDRMIEERDMVYANVNKLAEMKEIIDARQKQKCELEMLGEENKLRNNKILEAINITRAEIEDQQAKNAALRNEIESVNVEIAASNVRLKDLELKELQMTEAYENIKDEIIGEDEQLEFENLIQTKQQLEESIELNQLRLHSLKKQLTCMTQADEILSTEFIETMKALVHGKDQQNGALNEEKSLQSQIRIKQEQIEDLTLEVGGLKEKHLSIQEKTSQVVSAWDIKKRNMIAEMNQMKLNLEEATKANYEHEIVNSETLSEIERLKRDIALSNEECRQFDADISKHYSTLKKVVLSRNEATDKACLTLSNTLQKNEDLAKALSIDLQNILKTK